MKEAAIDTHSKKKIEKNRKKEKMFQTTPAKTLKTSLRTDIQHVDTQHTCSKKKKASKSIKNKPTYRHLTCQNATHLFQSLLNLFEEIPRRKGARRQGPCCLPRALPCFLARVSRRQGSCFLGRIFLLNASFSFF